MKVQERHDTRQEGATGMQCSGDRVEVSPVCGGGPSISNAGGRALVVRSQGWGEGRGVAALLWQRQADGGQQQAL